MFTGAQSLKLNKKITMQRNLFQLESFELLSDETFIKKLLGSSFKKLLLRTCICNHETFLNVNLETGIQIEMIRNSEILFLQISVHVHPLPGLPRGEQHVQIGQLAAQ